MTLTEFGRSAHEFMGVLCQATDAHLDAEGMICKPNEDFALLLWAAAKGEEGFTIYDYVSWARQRHGDECEVDVGEIRAALLDLSLEKAKRPPLLLRSASGEHRISDYGLRVASRVVDDFADLVNIRAMADWFDDGKLAERQEGSRHSYPARSSADRDEADGLSHAAAFESTRSW